MKPPIPLHDPRFQYIPARDHDADSRKFYERQMERMRRMQEKPQAQASNVMGKLIGGADLGPWGWRIG